MEKDETLHSWIPLGHPISKSTRSQNTVLMKLLWLKAEFIEIPSWCVWLGAVWMSQFFSAYSNLFLLRYANIVPNCFSQHTSILIYSGIFNEGIHAIPSRIYFRGLCEIESWPLFVAYDLCTQKISGYLKSIVTSHVISHNLDNVSLLSLKFIGLNRLAG